MSSGSLRTADALSLGLRLECGHRGGEQVIN